MKAVFLTTILLGAAAAATGQADPIITAKNFKCEFLPQVKGKWEKRGELVPKVQGRTLLLEFKATDDGSALDQMGTTNTDKEYQVEARCPGSITLSDNKPFKIRDFKFVVGGANIDSAKGKIELKVVGSATVDGTNQKDTFEKVWTVNRSSLETTDAFVSKQESTTVCGQKLVVRFDELRAFLSSEEDKDEFTSLSVESLNMNLDPC